MDLKIREFGLTLKNYINGMDLPPEIKRMAVKEAYDDIAAKADAAVSAELKGRNAEKEQEAEVKQDE